jgi:hypothetical protein
MREPADWAELELGPGVRLLLGWRDGSHLSAAPVDVSEDIGEELLTAARNQLQGIAALSRREFTGAPALEEDEYLTLSIGSSSSDHTSSATQPLSQADLATADVVELVRNAFGRDDFLTRADLEGGGWLFYMVVAELSDGSVLGFLRQYNPQRGIKPGRLVAAFQDTLTRFDDPIFNFDFAFDVVVAPDELAILRLTAFERVFSDVDAAMADVPANATAVNGALGIKLAPASVTRLTAACEQRATWARRLRRLSSTGHLGQVTAQSLRDKLAAHGLQRDQFGTGSQIDLASDDDVRTLLDMLEELYYEADFTGEHRRADRYSARP